MLLNPILNKIRIVGNVFRIFLSFIFAICGIGVAFASPVVSGDVKIKDLLIAARKHDLAYLKSEIPKLENQVLRNLIIDEAIANGASKAELTSLIIPLSEIQKSDKIQHITSKNKTQLLAPSVKIGTAEKVEIQNIKSAFFSGNDTKTIARSKDYLNTPIGGLKAYYCGLAAYRMGDFDQALLHLSFAANWRQTDAETAAQSAFWASRAAQKIGNGFLEDHYLKIASNFEFTFYGQLAKEKLGIWDDFLIPSQNSQAALVKKLINNNLNVKAALALCEIEEIALCHKQLDIAYKTDDGAHALGFYQLALALGFDDLENQIDKGDNFTAIVKSYPISEITPHGNEFVLDRALIYAIMRQESRFNSTAVSYAGARGLMQIMPSTAAWLAKNPAFRANPALLNNQKTNVTLGENYLEYLLNLNVTESSIPKVLVAYNAGPGNLNSWQKRMIKGQDTLMFIETIPNEQSRDYVKKVMANLWIYHKRLGQNAPSLKKLAQGKVPQYEPQDDPRTMFGSAANTIALKAK